MILIWYLSQTWSLATTSHSIGMTGEVCWCHPVCSCSQEQVKGARLFNLGPKDVRGMKGVTVDTFKAGLDA